MQQISRLVQALIDKREAHLLHQFITIVHCEFTLDPKSYFHTNTLQLAHLTSPGDLLFSHQYHIIKVQGNLTSCALLKYWGLYNHKSRFYYVHVEGCQKCFACITKRKLSTSLFSPEPRCTCTSNPTCKSTVKSQSLNFSINQHKWLTH